ncbi:hypothetical protein EIN_086830 [Entamoeba invadens IP1]|uniref:Uncharacterized protein n=1 Tax=Entamoeba invadens TaxID=33085 RepID=S0B1A1_ENTIV|nr:hypothetical protein EIN_086830 [Entamoeba invadens IP1]BAN40182.1 hypothetical protein [Entamoeba invadens]ELP85401.1 hypothetical protein EIN_086830 [Entamoeba invadens IP1]BAN40260.1 hypothetical protein [Entamoeba invadens]BAN40304.1 hypothetical protein [Entamoeba invadens]BAN40417.1 hypothetical protein [Entamoeba invadens]|eukprot:XP_004184747.1 hypothetical protein EIN_086830 [Entamoeba invadens IP1]
MATEEIDIQGQTNIPEEASQQEEASEEEVVEFGHKAQPIRNSDDLVGLYIEVDKEKYKVTAKLSEAVRKLDGDILVMLYTYRREKDKNYIEYQRVTEESQEVTFTTLVPRGIYDIRVCRCEFKKSPELTEPSIFKYECLYCQSGFIVGNPVKITTKVDDEHSQLYVELPFAAKEGDYIGIFNVNTNSMRCGNMVGKKPYDFGEGSIGKYFTFDPKTVGKDEMYEVRFFEKDSCIRNKIDHSFIPYAISQPFFLLTKTSSE